MNIQNLKLLILRMLYWTLPVQVASVVLIVCLKFLPGNGDEQRGQALGWFFISYVLFHFLEVYPYYCLQHKVMYGTFAFKESWKLLKEAGDTIP